MTSSTTPTITPGFDYSDRDYYSLRLRLQGLIRSVLPDWTDFNTANFGNLLVELFAYVGDILNFYQDAQAAEAFWPTLTQRISAIRAARLIDFTLTGASAASGTARVVTPSAHGTETATIAIDHRFQSLDPENPVTYQATAESILSASGTTVDVPIQAAETKEETFQSDDEPSQEFVLTYTPFLDGSMDTVQRDGSTVLWGLVAGDGDYTVVDSFLGYGPSDRVFLIMVDHLNRAHIRFGNGAIGAIPQGEITARYKVGGGTIGNLEDGRPLTILDPIYYGDLTVVTATATNYGEVSGGVDRMTLAEASAQAPASLRVQNRTVSKTDFETVAESVSGVARALMATSNEYAGIEENTGRLYVVAQGTVLDSGRISPASAPSAMLTSVEDEINNNKPPTVTFQFSAYTAEFLSVTVSARVYLAAGASQTTVAADIRAALYDFFAVQLSTGENNENIDFGVNLVDAVGETGELVWSDVFNVVRDVENVRKVDSGVSGLLLNGQRDSIQLLPIEFPQLTSITLTDADTGESI
jgi:hypothetical protein